MDGWDAIFFHFKGVYNRLNSRVSISQKFLFNFSALTLTRTMKEDKLNGIKPLTIVFFVSPYLVSGTFGKNGSETKKPN